jgi:hypothetical protein
MNVEWPACKELPATQDAVQMHGREGCPASGSDAVLVELLGELP